MQLDLRLQSMRHGRMCVFVCVCVRARRECVRVRVRVRVRCVLEEMSACVRACVRAYSCACAAALKEKEILQAEKLQAQAPPLHTQNRTSCRSDPQQRAAGMRMGVEWPSKEGTV